MRKLLKWVGVTLVTTAAITTTACNTIQGVGQDIESTGEAIEDAAK